MLALAVSASVAISGVVHVPFHSGSLWGLLLYISLVFVVVGTIAFAAFVVELHGGSWVSPCPGGSPWGL